VRRGLPACSLSCGVSTCEMKDVHPLVVLSPRAFNEKTGIVIGLPMTTATFNETHPFATKFAGPKGIRSYVVGHQPKSFDWRARRATPHGSACPRNRSRSPGPTGASRFTEHRVQTDCQFHIQVGLENQS
jgi:mRNA-degrading endonuclease toxin of MazEF toxin-antitoxin module